MAESVETPKFSTCTFCDGCCVLTSTEAPDELPSVAPADPSDPAICSKAIRWNEIRSYEKRLTSPLENIGTRGEPVWKEIGWDEALDKVAERLQAVIDEYGARSVAFSEMPLNHGFGGITRRFMNHLGTPNYITALDLCMGNTAQVHRATYGWFTAPVWETADCVVYFGQNRGPELWPGEYNKLRAALDRGAKLIVVDPRTTETANRADYHLKIHYGTDAALALAWLHVIIRDGLFDDHFVKDNTVGFDQLAERVSQYAPDRVADICGVSSDLIEATAYAYARSEAAIIPWGATADMQVNSTSLIRCQCIMRAICGFLNKSEMVLGPTDSFITCSQLEDFDALPADAKKEQIGYDSYPLFSFRAEEIYRETMLRAGIDHTVDILASSCMAHPSGVFAAMRGEGPYPVKAFFSVANNTVMSYANMPGIVEAFKNQDLVVVFETNMSPTAQLADIVLPGDMWMERDAFGPAFDMVPAVTVSRAFAEPPAGCRSWYEVLKGLSERLGFAQAFPWEDERALYDFRLAPMGKVWRDIENVPVVPCAAPHAGTFLTPSGKVELASSVLEQLGYDPLPHYVEPYEDSLDNSEYPFVIFAGSREVASYNTNLHQIDFLRRRIPEPELYVNPADATEGGFVNGDWVEVRTRYGAVELKVKIDPAQPIGTLRVPHGWWKPELDPGLSTELSGAMTYNDGMLFPDADWNLDREQGLANLRGGIHAKVELISSIKR